MKTLLMVLATLSLSVCDLNTQPEDHPTDPATETFDSRLDVNISTMTKTTNEPRCATDPHYCVYYKDIAVGTGATLTTATTVTMTYGQFVKTAAVVNSGDHVPISVITMPPGLQEGLAGMKIGGNRVIVVPSALGYGNNSVGSVPPNSTLIFQVILNSFQ